MADQNITVAKHYHLVAFRMSSVQYAIVKAWVLPLAYGPSSSLPLPWFTTIHLVPLLISHARASFLLPFPFFSALSLGCPRVELQYFLPLLCNVGCRLRCGHLFHFQCVKKTLEVSRILDAHGRSHRTLPQPHTTTHKSRFNCRNCGPGLASALVCVFAWDVVPLAIEGTRSTRRALQDF